MQLVKFAKLYAQVNKPINVETKAGEISWQNNPLFLSIFALLQLQAGSKPGIPRHKVDVCMACKIP